MRLVRVRVNDAARVGVRQDEGIRLAPPGVTIGDMLAQTDLRAAVEADGEPVSRGVTLLPPLDPSAVMVNVGANYHDHALPSHDAGKSALTWFLKSPRSWIAAGEAIRIPPHHAEHVDYEGELGVVFGAECHRVDEGEAWSRIAAVTLLNDVSSRDAWPALSAASTPSEEREAWNLMMLGKQLPTFGPVGPDLVTLDDVADPAGLVLRTRLNGSLVQDAHVSRMRIGIAELVSRLSEYFRFQPGDVISTGSPGGVGQERGRFLRPGDEVSVDVEGVGTLTNPVL